MGLIRTYDVGGQRFALVPGGEVTGGEVTGGEVTGGEVTGGEVTGGEVTIGYDANRFVPTDDQRAEYDELGFDRSIEAFVDEMTTPRRTVTVGSLLVAVDAVAAGEVEVTGDHPRIAELLDGRRGHGRRVPQEITWHGRARVELEPDGGVRRAWLLDVPAYEDEVARLAALGQRLMTPDEWEHACGAGAPTLFRWGDDVPDDHFTEPGVHREPNAFGLHIGEDPYRAERTADPLVACGGDGGSMAHHGPGPFTSWLTLATAFRDVGYGEFLHESGRGVGEMMIRPVIPVDPGDVPFPAWRPA